MGGEDAAFLQLDEKTPEALLQLGIGITGVLRSVSGSLCNESLGSCGVVNATPLFTTVVSNFCGQNRRKTVPGGQFRWGAVLNFQRHRFKIRGCVHVRRIKIKSKGDPQKEFCGAHPTICWNICACSSTRPRCGQ